MVPTAEHRVARSARTLMKRLDVRLTIEVAFALALAAYLFAPAFLNGVQAASTALAAFSSNAGP
jgi:hypothetical protein